MNVFKTIRHKLTYFTPCKDVFQNDQKDHGLPTLLPAETRSRRPPAGSPTAAPLRTFRQDAWPASDGLASPVR